VCSIAQLLIVRESASIDEPTPLTPAIAVVENPINEHFGLGCFKHQFLPFLYSTIVICRKQGASCERAGLNRAKTALLPQNPFLVIGGKENSLHAFQVRRTFSQATTQMCWILWWFARLCGWLSPKPGQLTFRRSFELRPKSLLFDSRPGHFSTAMSEYQYYEFLAINEPLSAAEMGELRAISTRAEITPTTFTNEYNWGNLKADPKRLVEHYFDAYVYVANWGTRRFMMRFPSNSVDFGQLETYVYGERATINAIGEHVLIDMWSAELRHRNVRKSSFVARLRTAGLLTNEL